MNFAIRRQREVPEISIGILNIGKWETEKKDVRISEDDTSTRSILDCEFGFAVLTGDTAYCAREMVTAEGFDVFDFKAVEV